MLFVVLFALALTSDSLAEKAEQAKQAMASQDFERAVALYRDLSRAVPGDVAVQQNLGIALYSAGRYAESVRTLDQVLRADPNNKPALLFSGINWNRLGEPRRAVPPLKKFLAETGETAAARLELGHAHFELTELNAAVEDFSKASALEPSNPASWKGLGVTYWALAKNNFDSIDNKAPFSPEWCALMARFELQKEHPKRAFQLYRQAASKSPNLPGVHAGLAEVYRRTGHADWAAVEEDRERSAQIHGGSEITRLYLEAIEDQRRAAEAMDSLEKLPAGREIHELLGFAYRAQSRDAESAAEFQRALLLEPNNARLKEEFATSLWLSGDCSQAEPILEMLLRANPNSPQLNHILGDCLVRDKRPQEAIPFLKTALQFDPAFLPAHASLGRAYAHLDRYSEAIPHLKQAAALQDKSILFQLAQAYKKIGDEASGTRYLQEYRRYTSATEAFSRLPDNAEITRP
jgi:tetratricopeptide (TPR) repeat protein